MWGEFLKIIKDIFRIYIDKKVARAAAQLSYCLMLSIFPLLICVNAMLAGFDITELDILNYGGGIIPVSTVRVISDYLGYVSENNSPAMLAGALLLVATTSSASFRALLTIMSEIQDKPRFTGFWPAIFSFIYSIFFLAAVYLSLIVIVTGNWFLQFVADSFGVRNIAGGVWQWIRFVMLFAVLLLIVYGVYKLTAPREKPHRQRILGATAATTALVLVSIFFSWSIEMSARYSLVYGSITSVIILMIWLFFCGNVVICGNIVNLVINKKQRPS